MESKGQRIVTCPNCGSNKVKVTTAGASGCAGFGFGFILIVGGIWIPVIGWFVLIPLGGMIMLVSLIAPMFAKNASVTCQECEHKFSISKEKMQKYNRYINK
ncbi:hypothetical protein IGJ28_000774 [Enterococcus sp. AZ091]|uniref:hypothetical protein n=1 Tax=Enterococcus sp. AZ091 TaxID=2774720 RepID=UPI003F26CEE1